MKLENHDYFEQKLAEYDLTLQQLKMYNLRPFGGFIRDTFHCEDPSDLDLYIFPLEACRSTVSAESIARFLVKYFTDLGWDEEKIVRDQWGNSGTDEQYLVMKHLYRFRKNGKQIDLVEFDLSLENCLRQYYDFSCNTFIYDPYKQELYVPGKFDWAARDAIAKYYMNLQDKVLYCLNVRNMLRLGRIEKLLVRGWKFNWESFWHYFKVKRYSKKYRTEFIKSIPLRAKEMVYACALTDADPEVRAFVSKFDLAEIFDNGLFHALLYLKFS